MMKNCFLLYYNNVISCLLLLYIKACSYLTIDTCQYPLICAIINTHFYYLYRKLHRKEKMQIMSL